MLHDKVDTVIVKMWGMDVAAITWLEQGYAVLEYTDSIQRSSLNISPLVLPVHKLDSNNFPGNVTTSSYSFPELNPNSFKGLPGLLADSLSDGFSAVMFDEYQSRRGRSQEQLNPVEMLCALGNHAMGALEFRSSANSTKDEQLDTVAPVKIEDLYLTLKSVLLDRGQMQLSLSDEDDEASESAFNDLLRVTTSAGGSQPKAVIAINETTGEMLSGQGEIPAGYDHWLLKFDEIDDSKKAGLLQSTRIEYAYALMARAAKINISECRLLEENDRAHFITRRFDRKRTNGSDSETCSKLHVQSLFALAHYDFTQPGIYSYEQAFEVMRQLHLPKSASLELYRRMLFNIFARNQNDHTKNVSFLMGESGKWKLAPAYNLSYSYDTEDGRNLQHQMSVNGKCDNFTLEDLIVVGDALSLPKVERTINEVKQAVSQWPTFAKRAGIRKKVIGDISQMHRLSI